jgi:hypothetical protein
MSGLQQQSMDQKNQLNGCLWHVGLPPKLDYGIECLTADCQIISCFIIQ